MANKNNEDIIALSAENLRRWQADLLPATVSIFVTGVLSSA